MADVLEERDLCAYCGVPATDREHVIPRSFLDSIQTIQPLARTEIVPSCGECNSLAGNKVFSDFHEKRTYLRGAVERRYERLLAAPRWTEQELAELGHGLRSHILAPARARVAEGLGT